MNMNAENPDQKFTADDVKEAKKPMAAKVGFILDCDYSHWAKFLTDGELDTGKLAKGNYSPEQTEYIADEMQSLGWLGTEEPSKDTAPLPELDGED